MYVTHPARCTWGIETLTHLIPDSLEFMWKGVYSLKRGCRRPSKGDPDGLAFGTEDRDREVYGFMIQGRFCNPDDVFSASETMPP